MYWRVSSLLVLLFIAMSAGVGLAPAEAFASLPLGHLDSATPTLVGGWAFDPDHPEAEIAIHIYVDGQFAGNGETKGYRPDVNEMFGITGNHGFTFPVDLAPFGNGVHDVCAYGIDLDGEGNPAFDPCPTKVTVSVCTPSCAGKTCGDDGCGGSCGNCPGGQSCQNGQCVGGGGDAMAEGHLDAANQDMVGGWAKDPDWDGPIPVHIYVGGSLAKVVVADQWREDVGAHGFSWNPPPYGHGNHEVIAYAIGVDGSGNPTGQNPGLPGSPLSLQASCDGLESDALGWCQGLPPYWTNRQADTTFVDNDSVRAGVNTSYGGTILQFYGPGWDRNLVLEHGGGAVQLSIWGYDPVGGVGWYGSDSCDPVGYGSQDECLAAGHSGCSPWAHPGGAHVSDCVNTHPCGGWTPGAPWNPIQAQGPECGWDSPLNNCNAVNWEGSTLYTRLDAPFHFTSTNPPPPMPMEQRVTAHAGYVEIQYRLTYNGPYAWCPHPQEIPAIFTAAGMHQHFYYYGGGAPFTGDSVTHQQGPTGTHLRYPNRETYGHGDNYAGYVTEGWWGACDASQERCLTVASFSELMNEVPLLHQNQSGGSGYVTALGYFGVYPGMDLQWTVYLFPYRYDHDLGGQTVRDVITSLAPAEFKQQACAPDCAGKECGPDGCGGSCGSCLDGGECDGSGHCTNGACQPDCAGKQCGPDGCDGTCGTCTPGLTCTDAGICVSNCEGSCEGKECGTDGCGTSCGVCPADLVCAEGKCVEPCVPSCEGKQCGGDGCGGWCGSCGFGMVCTQDGQCMPEDEVDPEDRWQPDAGSTVDVLGSDSDGPDGRGEDVALPGSDTADGGGPLVLPATDGEQPGSGCKVSSRGRFSGGLLLLGLLLGLLLARRRRRREPSSPRPF